MRALVFFSLALAFPALARPWNGIAPGVNVRADVVKKFGEPSKVTETSEHELLTYLNEKAIKGTAQAHFRVEKQSGLVARIDVIPDPAPELDDLVRSYGGECAGGESGSCYLRRSQGNKRPYFLYSRLGLAVFFRDDGRTVQSLSFIPGQFAFLPPRKKPQ